MAKQRFVENKCCMVCDSDKVQWHHVFFGTANRRKSTEFGYVIPLCMEHHTGCGGVHRMRELDLYFKRMAQEHFELNYGDRGEFIAEFGKSYL